MFARPIAAALVSLSVCTPSLATITVTVRKSGGDVVTHPSSGDPITITLDDTVTRIWITSDSPSTEDIGRVTLSGSRGSTTDRIPLLIRGNEVVPTEPEGFMTQLGCRDWAGLAQTSGLNEFVTVYAAVGRDVTDTVHTGAIFRLQIGRDLLSPIVVTNEDSWNSEDIADFSTSYIQVARNVADGADLWTYGSIGVYEVGLAPTAPHATAEGAITAGLGKIGNIKIGGSLTGIVTCKHGIDRIEAGYIGTAITANYGNSTAVPDPIHDGYIQEIIVTGLGEPEGGNIDAPVIANHFGFPTDSTPSIRVGSIIVSDTIGQPLTFIGDVYGSICADRIEGDGEEPTIVVQGTLYNNILSRTVIDWVHVLGAVESPIQPDWPVNIEAGDEIGFLIVDGAMGNPPCAPRVGVRAPVINLVMADYANIAVTGSPQYSCAGGPPSQVIGAELHELRVLGSPANGGGSLDGIIYAARAYVIEALGDYRALSLIENSQEGDVVRIGGSLGRYDDDCDPETNLAPAWVWTPDGLGGQIIINARHDSNPGLWDGEARVLGTEPDITLAPESDQPDLAPYYDRRSSEFGGGAVGLVPYRLHHADCEPTNGAEYCTETIATLQWPDAQYRETIVLRFYGPVSDALPEDEETPIVLEWLPLAYPCDPPPAPCNPAFTGVDAVVAVRPFNKQREVWVSTESGEFEGESIYRVTPRVYEGRKDLFCKGTFAQSYENTVDVYNFVYTVSLGICMDLNSNMAIEDGDLIEWVMSPADFNADGAADDTDFLLLIDAVFSR